MVALPSLCLSLLIIGLLAGCASTGGTSPPQALAAPAPAVAAQSVPVALVDYRIQMPQSVPAGVISFLVTNRGSHAHNFEIRGPSVSQRFATDLQPGEARLMQARLAPGNYTVICPVDAHTLLGMQTRLTVH